MYTAFLNICFYLNVYFIQENPLKVKVTRSFNAESAGFLSGETGELITLISKDRHRFAPIRHKIISFVFFDSTSDRSLCVCLI